MIYHPEISDAGCMDAKKKWLLYTPYLFQVKAPYLIQIKGILQGQIWWCVYKTDL